MLGAHLSIAGGLHNALLSAEKFGMDTVQVFTKNQQQWKCTPLRAEAINQWRRHLLRLKFKRTVSHDSYLINLASPDELLWRKSLEVFIEELRRCEQLGIPYLVTHPGAHAGAGEQFGLKRVVQALDLAHQTLPEAKVLVCLEVTAGMGTSLGYKLEQLAEIIQRVEKPRRAAVCLDTAHLFAAGYDFRGRRYARFRKHLDSLIGLKRVKVIHMNDSKKPLGSRVDRHDHIGRGLIGLSGFRGFMQDEAFEDVPKILETPKGKSRDSRDWDEVNLEALRGLLPP